MAQLFRKSAIERLASPEQLDKAIVVTSPLSWLSLIGVFLIIASFVVWSFCGTMPSTISAKGVISNGTFTNSVHSEFGGTIEEVCINEGDSVRKGDVLCRVIDANNNVQNVLAKEDCIITKQLIEKNDVVNYSDELFGISMYSSDDFYVVFYVGIEQLAGIHSGMDVIFDMSAYDSQKYGHMKGKVAYVDSFAATEASIRRVLGNNDEVLAYLQTTEQPVAAVTCKLEKDKTSDNSLYWSNEKGKEVQVNIGSIVNAKVVKSENAPITKLIPGLK